MNIAAIPTHVQTLMQSLQNIETVSCGPAPDYANILVHPPLFYADGQIKVHSEHDSNGLL